MSSKRERIFPRLDPACKGKKAAGFSAAFAKI
jgi:hypothetical protein